MTVFPIACVDQPQHLNQRLQVYWVSLRNASKTWKKTNEERNCSITICVLFRLQQEAVLGTLITQIRLVLFRQVQISGHLITLPVRANTGPTVQHSRNHGQNRESDANAVARPVPWCV